MNRTKRKSLTTLIIVMLVMVMVAVAWIFHLEGDDKFVSFDDIGQAEQSIEDVLKKAEEEAEDAEVASHVYSHRGSAGPEEHSFKAYDAAIEVGSRYIEQDLVISSDGVLYVSHDENAVTMTGYNGLYEYLSSETIDGLRTDAGNKVLRLSEVFDRYGKDINYVIELKLQSDACREAFEDLVDQYGYSDVITVQSKFPDVLEKLESKYPDMPKLFVCRSQSDFDYYCDAPYIDIISVKAAAGLMTESNCRIAHEQGKIFSAWTLDAEADIRSAIDIGVDTYFTNDTPLALSLEREYGLKVRATEN